MSDASADDLLLPPDGLLLHIGPYKTGSTAIQAALHEARPRLRDLGVIYPGTGVRERAAGWAVLDAEVRGRARPRIEQWQRYAGEVRDASDVRVCVSNEDFGRAGPAYAQRIVSDLGAERVHVVFVARRYDTLLPSQWQERVKNFTTLRFEEYVAEVVAPDAERHPSGRAFWTSHGPGPVARWAEVVGPERVTVVVSDSADPGLLARTFERMLGVPAGTLVLDSARNVSLSPTGSEVVRRANLAFERHGWSDVLYDEVVRKGLVPGVRDVRELDLAPVPRLDGPVLERLVELADQQVTRLRGLGVRVVGDLDALLVPGRGPAPPDGERERPSGVADHDGGERPRGAGPWVSLDFVEGAVAGMLAGAAGLEERRRRQWGRQGRRSRGRRPSAPRTAGRVGSSPAAAPGGRRVADTSGRDLAVEVLGRAVRRLVRRP